jgi:hypothetical protein
VISGPPGAGKSTVGRVVASHVPTSVSIESDWFYTAIVNGFIPPWDPASHDQNRTVLRAAFATAARFAAGGYGVVFEGVVGPGHLDLALDELHDVDAPVSYAVLRPDLDTCLERATGRAGEVPRVAGNPPLTDEGPVRSLWQRFADLGPYEANVIDTGGIDAGTAAHLVIARLEDGSLRLP